VSDVPGDPSLRLKNGSVQDDATWVATPSCDGANAATAVGECRDGDARLPRL
jgi:hypothetical protein